MGATRLQHVMSGDPAFTEYVDPLSPAMTGHTMAKGATAVAAYDPFRPFLPEPFTSPGGDVPIFFDSAGNRYAEPQIRRVPQVAGADRGNTTFFAADDLRDPDTQPNFGGTSASAPHVASIAALALEKAGGGKALHADGAAQPAAGVDVQARPGPDGRARLRRWPHGRRPGRAGQRELHDPPGVDGRPEVLHA